MDTQTLKDNEMSNTKPNIQIDDKIIVAGNFTTFNGSTASRIARLGGDFAG